MSGGPKKVRNWRTPLAAVFVMLVLTGCAQGIAGQTGTPYWPSSPEHQDRNVPEHGGGDGGGQRWRGYVAGEALYTGAYRGGPVYRVE